MATVCWLPANSKAATPPPLERLECPRSQLCHEPKHPPLGASTWGVLAQKGGTVSAPMHSDPPQSAHLCIWKLVQRRGLCPHPNPTPLQKGHLRDDLPEQQEGRDGHEDVGEGVHQLVQERKGPAPWVFENERGAKGGYGVGKKIVGWRKIF